jgi:alkanesulfonate monooxygenase SsuD/methylene tetrahydromethanopterin reductase-like flavin-dependent oxidoreductase (luciferase family)
VLDANTPANAVATALDREKATIWLAEIEQVFALAGQPEAAARLAAHLAAVVLPIGSLAELPRAREAIEAFREAFGIEPVVAYAPPEVGGLVAMNTPAKRIEWDHETINRPETVGRVVNGVVVWPQAGMRHPLGLPSLAAEGIPDDATATLAIAATGSKVALLADAFDVDKDGFLTPRA